MFCQNCGEKLDDGTRFCPSCGTRVDSVNDRQTEALQQSQEALPILGYYFNIPSNMNGYLKIRELFSSIADKNAKNFSSTFYSRYRDMDGFARTFTRDFQAMIAEATNALTSVLSANQVFGVTTDEISNYAQRYCYHTFNLYGEITEKYCEITGHQEELRQYRQMRKANRGRVIGGGFGFSGAVQGMAAAGAINMATGMLHSLGNTVGNIGSAISAANAKDRLFKSGISSKLERSIHADLLNFHLVTCDILHDRAGISLPSFTDEKRDRALKIQEDIEQGKISSNYINQAILSMLSTYPFEADLYRTALKFFPDRLEDIRGFSEYFGFNIDKLYSEVVYPTAIGAQVVLEYRNELDDILLYELGFDESYVGSLTTNISNTLHYFKEIFSACDEKGYILLPLETDKGIAKLNSFKKLVNIGSRTPLILFDNTFSGTCSEGFIVTDKYLYVRTSSTVHIYSLPVAIKQLRQDSSNYKYLRFSNDVSIYISQPGEIAQKGLIGDFLQFLLAMIAFSTSIRHRQLNLWAAIDDFQIYSHVKLVEQSASKRAVSEISGDIDQDNENYDDDDDDDDESAVNLCPNCGAEIEDGAKFCCECGTRFN